MSVWSEFNARAASSLLAEQDSVTIAGAISAALPRRKAGPVPVAVHGLARGRQDTVRVRRNVTTGAAERPFPAVRHIAATARRLAEQRPIAISERPAGLDRRRGELVPASISPALGVPRPVLDVRSFATLAPRPIRQAATGGPCRLRQYRSSQDCRSMLVQFSWLSPHRAQRPGERRGVDSC